MLFGAGMAMPGQKGCAGSDSSGLDTCSGGLEGMSRSEDGCSVNGDKLSPSSTSVDGRERQNSGTGWLSCTSDSVGLMGLGKDGMLNADERSDCREVDLVNGEADS